MSIYKTAAMSLLTGILGSGKTLRAVGLMKQAIADDEKVYQSGFKNLQVPGVVDWEDPRKWQELPSGAILFVDEAQKWFGERRHGAAPEYLKAMNTMRGEEGVRMVLLTQHPKYLDAHVKDLVGCHEHLLRESGKASSKLWRSDEIMEDPRSPRGRAKADSETFKFPQEDFASYTSANSAHTIKYRMPAVLKKAILFGGLGVSVLIIAWVMLFRGAYADVDKAQADTGGGMAVSPTATPLAASSTPQSGSRSRSPAELLGSLKPLAPEAPWLADAYMNRPIVAEPRVVCMSSGHDGADGCTCLTEQGTRHFMPKDRCVHIARHGEVYNPFKAPPREQNAQVESRSAKGESRGVGDKSPTETASPGAVIAAERQVSGYGDIGARQLEPAS